MRTDILSSNEGILGASLVREFLGAYNLDYTVKVYDSELNEVKFCFNLKT